MRTDLSTTAPRPHHQDNCPALWNEADTRRLGLAATSGLYGRAQVAEGSRCCFRVTRGTVNAGREADFIGVCREQVGDIARAPGLVVFMAGYRRVGGADQFILATTWETEEDAQRSAGPKDRPLAVDRLEGIATVEHVDHYKVLDPSFRGIVDAPGGVIRFTSGKVARRFRQKMLTWLQNPPRSRAQDIQRLMLGWAVGERDGPDDDSIEVAAVSAWPSPLVIEAVADQGRTSEPLYAEVDQFASDFHVEQYRAISLELPDSMSDIGSRRVVAAQFPTHDAATMAASELASTVIVARDAQISVAPLGAPGTASDVRSFVLVARVAINEYARAERLISDNGGEVILSQPDRGAAPLDAADGMVDAPHSLAPDLSPAS